jgi:hypothetical protein
MKVMRLLIFSLCILAANSGWAYLSMGESGEILPQGTNLFGFEPQVLINEGGGINAGTFLDMPWRDDLSSRFSLGAGKIDFHLGAALKYVPFPDVDKQPAIGVKVAAWYARQGSLNTWTFQVAPLFSKKFMIDAGTVVPYAAIPFNFASSTDANTSGTEFTVGSEFHPKDSSGVFYSAEMSLNLKDSYSFVSGTVAFPFDSEKGFRSRGQ